LFARQADFESVQQAEACSVSRIFSGPIFRPTSAAPMLQECFRMPSAFWEPCTSPCAQWITLRPISKWPLQVNQLFSVMAPLSSAAASVSAFSVEPGS